MNEILEGIEQNERDFGSHPTTQRALERCAEPIEDLTRMIESFAEGFTSKNAIRRKWTALDSVRKNDQISKFKSKVQEAKLSLMLAQQCSAA